MLVSVQLTIPAGFAVQKNGVCELVHGGTWGLVGTQVFADRKIHQSPGMHRFGLLPWNRADWICLLEQWGLTWVEITLLWIGSLEGQIMILMIKESLKRALFL